MKQVASLQYGVIFKKAFCDVDVFKGFVRDILGFEIDIDHVETEKEFKTAIGNVAAKFDLFAEDKQGRVIVEIQHRYAADDHYDRFLHYHCMALLEQVKNAKNYKPPRAVYTIVVLTSADTKYREDVLSIDFDLKNKDGQFLGEIPHRIIYLCPRFVSDRTPVAYREWLEIIDDSLDNQIDESHYLKSEMQKIMQHIENDGISPQERAQMIEEYNFEQFTKKQFDEGIKQGKLEGLEEGELKAKQAIAKNLLVSGLDVQAIANATNLTIEEIEQLRDNL